MENTPRLIFSDEKIKEYSEEISIRNSDIACKGAFFVALVEFLISGMFNWTSIETILCGFNTLVFAFAAFFALHFFGARMKYLSEIVCIVILIIIMPFHWFRSGGLYGVGGIWILYTAIYAMFGSYGKIRYVLLSVIAVEMISIVSLTYAFPNLVSQITRRQERVIGITSIIVIGSFVLYVGIKQRVIADEATIKIAMMQDDLTAQNQELIAINEELIDLTDKLKTANETQRHFTASMNHELRAPLNGVEGCLQVLIRSENLTKTDKETINNALISCKSINQTVNDLLDIAKLEQGKFDIVKSQFDLRDLLENILNIFASQASAKGLSFQIKIPRSTRVSVISDAMRIQQIMTNLLSNAIKYTAEGTVMMSVDTIGCKLNFSISDTGQGMTQEQLDILYDPFTRFNVHNNMHIQGTGLGMNIVYNLVKEMKGKIEVESEIGVGTTFRVSLPIMFYDSDITFSKPKEKDSVVVDGKVLEGLNILSVDDRKINRMVLRGLLTPCNVKLTDFDNGRKAVESCKNVKYDVIILDHMMPDIDGLETMELIRADGQNKETPILMLSGNTSKEYRDTYLARGCAGYIEKPIIYEDLISQICRASGR